MTANTNAGGGNEARNDAQGTTTPVQTETRANPAPGTTAAAPDAAAIRAEAAASASAILALCHRHGLDQAFSADLIGRGVTLARWWDVYRATRGARLARATLDRYALSMDGAVSRSLVMT